MAVQQRIITNLWFDSQAEEAANFYVSIFKNSSITSIRKYGKEGFEIHQRPEGSVMTVEFILDGHTFIALNGGPLFKFNEAISIMVTCSTQEEIDYYWEKLTEDGDDSAQQCGWLKDKFGLSWQVTPEILDELIADHHSPQYAAVLRAMFKMKKMDIAGLKAAAESVGPTS